MVLYLKLFSYSKLILNQLILDLKDNIKKCLKIRNKYLEFKKG